MSKHGASILIADDDEFVSRALWRALTAAGYEVSTARDGLEALTLAEARAFDIVLTDDGMPGMTGVELLRRLHEDNNPAARLLMSGDLDLEGVVAAVNEVGVARVLQKPLNVRAVAAMIDALLIPAEVDHPAVVAHRETCAHLRRCLDEGLLHLVVQPIVTAKRHEIVAYETLMRSRHPVLDNPAKVLRAAEQCGALPEIAAFVLRAAAELLAKLGRFDRLFINLHPSDLEDPDRLMENVRPLVAHSNRIVFELTERSRLLEVAGWATSLRELKRAGFSLALDDIGAGYSSLSLLAELKPHYVKVDMSLVRDIHRQPDRRFLVELLVRYARSTGTVLIAEGIETRDEAITLRRLGVPLQQGYYFGRPVPWEPRAIEVPGMVDAESSPPPLAIEPLTAHGVTPTPLAAS